MKKPNIGSKQKCSKSVIPPAGIGIRQPITMKRVLLILVIAISMSTNAGADSARRYTVTAENPKEASSGVLKFKHGDIHVDLYEDGTWSVEGPVTHRGFLCSTYELGVRFGDAETGCVNVNWLSDTDYVSSHTQCNNATMMHKGESELKIPAEEKFKLEEVSCAQISILCTKGCD